jgi:nucleotide-binding universal stress UspA family protein
MTLSGDLTSELKTRAQQDLDTFLKQELDNVGVKRVLLEGDPAQKIVEYAHSEESDLIMMPTHGYGPFRRLLLGSITSKVLHDSDCAVWTGVHSEGNPSGGPMVLGQILCAIDLGPHSAKTLGWADRLAAEFKSRLSIVHVVPSLDPRTEEYYFSAEWRQFILGMASTEIQQLQQSVGSHAEVGLEMGDVATSVCLTAERLKADLLVVGRGAMAGALGRFRTHAYAIIRQAPCPVASV